MGCGSTKTAPISMESNDYDFQLMIERVQESWTIIKKIDNLGPKIFAHLLHVYPVLKRSSNVSLTLKTEADLLRVNEVRELGNMLLAVYSDIIKSADVNLEDKIMSKAAVLNKQRIKPRLIKNFGESLCHVSTHQMNIKLSYQERQAWEDFIQYVSTRLNDEMDKETNNEI